jgi:glucosamine--fructose-6-phosphate aminotransferase (isomerizing)
MCGIVAYRGRQKCLPFLLDGMKRLEYRGYDSAGVAYIIGDKIFVQKQAGCVGDLITNRIDFEIESYMGMGHTRWATHGKPCLRNSHPHVTMDDRLAIVHNGIIENSETLKKELKEKGYMFRSDTDSEVLLYLIYDYLISEAPYLFDAVRLALERVVGAYAIVVMDRKLDNRKNLVVARKGSPLVIGVGKEDGEYFVASDPIAIVNYADRLVYMEDNTICRVGDSLTIFNMIEGEISSCNILKMEHQLYGIEKGNYNHFMMKEIFEQPERIKDCLAGRIHGYKIKLGGLAGYEDILSQAKHITIISCGSSWHAALMGKYYIEEFVRIKVSVEYASEFRYRKPAIGLGDIVIGISQSGETADTLNAMEMAKSKGAVIIGICNVVNSSLARLTGAGIYTRAGMEIGVASTKAFTNQVLSLILLALWMEQYKAYRKMDIDYRQLVIGGLKDLAELVDQTLTLEDEVKIIAQKFMNAKNCLFLGREYNFPIALEGALKLKEISYVHAEGYPAAEMKHGPIALIDKKMPVIVLANNKQQYDKILNNIKEIQAREGKIIALYSGDEYVGDYGIQIPDTLDALCPFLSNIIVQLFAYHSAVLRNCNVDKPRNLAKSVTVE